MDKSKASIHLNNQAFVDKEITVVVESVSKGAVADEGVQIGAGAALAELAPEEADLVEVGVGVELVAVVAEEAVGRLEVEAANGTAEEGEGGRHGENILPEIQALRSIHETKSTASYQTQS